MRKYKVDLNGPIRIYESEDGVPFGALASYFNDPRISEFERQRLKRFISENKPNLFDIAPKIAEFNNAPKLELNGDLGDDNSISVYKFTDGTVELFLEQTYPQIDGLGNEYESINRTVVWLFRISGSVRYNIFKNLPVCTRLKRIRARFIPECSHDRS